MQDLRVGESLERAVRVVLAQGDRNAARLKLLGFVIATYDEDQPAKAKQYYTRLGYTMKEVRGIKRAILAQRPLSSFAPQLIQDLSVNAIYRRLDGTQYVKLSETMHAKVLIKSKSFGLDGKPEVFEPLEPVIFVVMGDLEGPPTKQ